MGEEMNIADVEIEVADEKDGAEHRKRALIDLVMKHAVDAQQTSSMTNSEAMAQSKQPETRRRKKAFVLNFREENTRTQKTKQKKSEMQELLLDA